MFLAIEGLKPSMKFERGEPHLPHTGFRFP